MYLPRIIVMSVRAVAEALPVAVGDDGLLVRAGIHGGSLLQLSSCVYILNRFKYHYLMTQSRVSSSYRLTISIHGTEKGKPKKEQTCILHIAASIFKSLVQQKTMLISNQSNNK